MIDLLKPKEGSLGTYLPYWGFVAPDAVLTTDGQILFFFELWLDTVDGRGPDGLDATTQAWQRLLAAVEPPHRVFVLFERPEVGLDVGDLPGDTVAVLAQRKRRAWVSRRVRRMASYLVVAFQPGMRHHVRVESSRWWLSNVRRWFRDRRRQEHLTFYLREVVERVLVECRTLCKQYESLVDAVTPLRRLEGDEIGGLLFRVVNQGQGEWSPTAKPPPYGLNWRLAGETVTFERQYMRVGDRVVGLFSMALPPQKSGANALGELWALPYDFTAVLEWRSVDKTAALARIRAVQKHYNTQRWSFWAGMTGTEGTDMALDDAPSSAAVDQLYRAALEVDTYGVAYGDCNLSIAVSAVDQSVLDQVGALVQRVFVQADGKAVRERYGQAAVWFQRYPGQRLRPLARPLLISSGQAAALAPLFSGAVGYGRCDHLDAPCLTQFETRWRTPYGFDLFAGSDVGHTLVLGSTGSGKSFLLNFLLLQALQYNPRVMILDLGGSYRWLTSLLGGNYLSMHVGGDGQGRQPSLKPFSLSPNERTYQFLTAWVERLLAIGGYQLQQGDATQIRRTVEDIYAYDRDQQQLGQFVRLLPQPMWDPLARWIGTGPWAPTFDGPPDEFDVGRERWQVIDLAGAQQHPDWCAAALFFLLEKLRLVVDDDAEIGALKLMVVDEAWKYVSDPAVLSALMEAAKTWRKRNAVLLLATQSVVDLTHSDQARALLEMLPTKLLLSNPAFPPEAAGVLNLSDAEFETVRGLEAKRELFLHRAQEKAVLRLEVDDETYWLATSSPTDAELRARMVAKFGLAGALVRLAAGERPDDNIGVREVVA